MRTGQTLPLRDDLAGRKPYGAPQIDVPVRLNTNENPYPLSPALVQAIADAVAGVAGRLNRYPDRDFSVLRDDLASYLGHGLGRDQIWAANGSNEVMLHLLLAFGGPGHTALGFEPSYSMHPEIAQTTSTGWVAEARGAGDDGFGIDPGRAVAAIREVQPDLVFIASPNNPTGTALPLTVIEEVYEASPGLVVIDEAYAEFSRDPSHTALDLLPGRERLVVTRTMSKAFAMAGTRLGYLAASPDVISGLRIVRMPYHLSAVTQAVARVALQHTDELLATVSDICRERDALVEWLRGRGLTAADSDTNFVLFGTFDDRHTVWQALLDRGVLIREVGPPDWLRVSIGTPAENAAFRNALDEVLADG